MKNTAAAARPTAEPPLAVAGIPAEAVHLAPIDVEGPGSLPRDHPAWQHDVLAVSSRVRAILAGLQPVVVRVLGFWDHAVRSIGIGRRSLEVDPSGSYRLR